jgi:hypothetical protein
MHTLLVVVLITLINFQAYSQKTDEDYVPEKNKKEKDETNSNSNWTEKLSFGGNLSLSFGTVTMVQVAPQVGYRVTERFIPGIGANYIYFKDPYGSTTIYGGSVFARYLIADNFFAYAEYESLNREVWEAWGDERRWIPIGLIGGGYRTNSEGLAFTISILYDVIQDPWSPYGNPVIRGGFFF